MARRVAEDGEVAEKEHDQAMVTSVVEPAWHMWSHSAGRDLRQAGDHVAVLSAEHDLYLKGVDQPC